MALDSALNRGSAVHVGCPWRTFLPVPDSTISQADRQASAYGYAGILAGALVDIATGYAKDLVSNLVNPLVRNLNDSSRE